MTLPDETLEGLVELVVAPVAERIEPQDSWPPWMTIETAARYLDVSVERLRKLKDRRRIPYHQEGVGCRVFFSRADLDQWLGCFRHGMRSERSARASQ